MTKTVRVETAAALQPEHLAVQSSPHGSTQLTFCISVTYLPPLEFEFSDLDCIHLRNSSFEDPAVPY